MAYTLNEWASEILAWAEEKGWNEDERSAGDWIALAHSELSEAFEAFRDCGEMETIWYRDSDDKPEGYVFELIDTMIRILHNLAVLDVDVDILMEEKMAFNKTREHRHGGKHA